MDCIEYGNGGEFLCAPAVVVPVAVAIHVVYAKYFLSKTEASACDTGKKKRKKQKTVSEFKYQKRISAEDTSQRLTSFLPDRVSPLPWTLNIPK